MASCLVFAINPASVFFSSAYSESLFAMCTFGGHALLARGMVTAAVVPWTAASYARANGTINSAWLLLRGISSALNGKSILDGLLRLLYHIILAGVVALPVRYHDIQGYDLHCSSSQEFQPTWCEEDRTTFSLYSWTQRRHWNVGFLRYYQWKQVPNFLLAAPILFLGFWAAYLWIDSSMKDYVKDKRMSLKLLVPWAFESLRRSIPPSQPHSSQDNGEELLLKNPYLLGHYAVLAAVCLVGLTIAHIQISTRLICSSCPAMIWFLTDRVIKSDRLGQAVLAYCGLYILLGVILHVNFLPWT
jgi:phosphatidylinositol glycan class V